MLVYTSIFLITLLYYFIAQNNHAMHNNKMLALYMFGLSLFVGLGDMIGGYDRYIYGDMFDSIADVTWGYRNFADVLYLKQGNEWGYFFWEIFTSLITRNRYIFILLTTFLIYYLIYKAFKKYINNYPIACVVFSAFFFFFTMTYLREVIGVTIAWQGIKYIWERKPLKFFAVLLLAATFHGSILIFAVMYFVPLKKFSKRNIKYFLFFAFLLGMTSLPMSLISIGIDATGKTDNYMDQDQGFRIEYVVEVFFIMWVIFKNYRIIPNDKKTLTMLNMCCALCGVLLFFMRFGQGGRFGWPFFLGLFYIFTVLASRKSMIKDLRSIIFIVCFLLFARVNYAWSSQDTPYKTFLTNGIPSGYEIYLHYEYDDHYTINKFYRPAFTFIDWATAPKK